MDSTPKSALCAAKPLSLRGGECRRGNPFPRNAQHCIAHRAITAYAEKLQFSKRFYKEYAICLLALTKLIIMKRMV